jgi:acetyl-CoA acyltransferase
MKPVYLIDGCRSPIGRGHSEKGMYCNLRADDLAVQTLTALLRRLPIEPKEIDDFFLGCVGQHLEQGKNLARLILLLAGLPQTIPGATINRLCASSLTALQMAADSIRVGTNRLCLVGGVEHLGHVPMTAAVDYNPSLFAHAEFQWTNMGLTAEKLADTYGITRAEQDEFAVESNRRYFRALSNGQFGREIVSIQLSDGSTVDRDEEPRQSTKESLAALKTPFKENGTVTAANSSGVSDGASMAAVGDEESVKRLNVKPLAKIRECVTIGLDPTVMGLGPVYAIPKLLDKAGLRISDIDLFEINEAFAAQVLACQRELKIPSDRLNVHGGAVALGHPLGMSGLRIAVFLAHTLVARSERYGIASMCVGHGQGVAMLLERA